MKVPIQKVKNTIKKEEEEESKEAIANGEREGTSMCGHQCMDVGCSCFVHLRRPPILPVVCWTSGTIYEAHIQTLIPSPLTFILAVTFRLVTIDVGKPTLQDKAQSYKQYRHYRILKRWVLNSITSIHVPNCVYCPVWSISYVEILDIEQYRYALISVLGSTSSI